LLAPLAGTFAQSEASLVPFYEGLVIGVDSASLSAAETVRGILQQPERAWL
jgi:hypothetical protein